MKKNKGQGEMMEGDTHFNSGKGVEETISEAKT